MAVAGYLSQTTVCERSILCRRASVVVPRIRLSVEILPIPMFLPQRWCLSQSTFRIIMLIVLLFTVGLCCSNRVIQQAAGLWEPSSPDHDSRKKEQSVPFAWISWGTPCNHEQVQLE